MTNPHVVNLCFHPNYGSLLILLSGNNVTKKTLNLSKKKVYMISHKTIYNHLLATSTINFGISTSKRYGIDQIPLLSFKLRCYMFLWSAKFANHIFLLKIQNHIFPSNHKIIFKSINYRQTAKSFFAKIEKLFFGKVIKFYSFTKIYNFQFFGLCV